MPYKNYKNRDPKVLELIIDMMRPLDMRKSVHKEILSISDKLSTLGVTPGYVYWVCAEYLGRKKRESRRPPLRPKPTIDRQKFEEIRTDLLDGIFTVEQVAARHGISVSTAGRIAAGTYKTHLIGNREG